MPAHPNVILLHSDQQRYDSLGCCGNPLVRTPHLDRLAAGGTVFHRHLVSNPICSPSRASLLTGLYPPGHGLWCNGMALNRREYARLDPRCEGLPADNAKPGGFCPEPVTMADMFAAAGYDTASFGKLHLTPYLAPEVYGYPESFLLQEKGALDAWTGPYYGFRHVELVLGHGEGTSRLGPYARWLRDRHPDLLRQMREGKPSRPCPSLGDLYVSPLPYAAHNTRWLADRLCRYLENDRPADRPFFAFVGFPDPHHPFTPCQDIILEFADAPVPVRVPGSVQQALRQAGLLPNWNAGLDARACEWVENRHWLFETILPDAWFVPGKRHALVCEGLDGAKTGGGKPVDLSHPLMRAFADTAARLDPGRRFLASSSSGPRFYAHRAEFGKGLHWDVHGPWKGESEEYWREDDALFRSEVGAPGASPVDIIHDFAGDLPILPGTADNALWRRTSWWIEWPEFVAEHKREPRDIEEYVDWSQARQARFLARAARACRSRFPRCGGFIVWMGHDRFPCTANTAILDLHGRPKPAALALAEVFRQPP